MLDGIAVFAAAGLLILFVVPRLTALFGAAGMAAGEILLLLPALIAVKRRGDSFSEAFGLRLPDIRSFFASLLIFFGADIFQNGIMNIMYAALGDKINTDAAVYQRFFSAVSPAVALICVALLPAVCEEILFRGYLLSRFRSKDKGAAAVIISSLMFAAAHFNIYKLVPAVIIGLAFGYIAYKTGSVLLPVIFHFLNNASSLISYYRASGNTLSDTTYIVFKSMSYIWGGIAVLGLGGVLVYFGASLLSRKKRRAGITVLIILLAVAMFAGGILGVILNEVSTAFLYQDKITVSENTHIEREMTLERNTVCFVSEGYSYDDGVSFDMKIVSKDGNTVYAYQSGGAAGGILMEKGSYTVEYDIAMQDSAAKKRDVYINTGIISFAGFERG